MIDIYKNLNVLYDIPNDTLINLFQIKLIPLKEFIDELAMDFEDFARTDDVLKTSHTLCNVETMERVMGSMDVLKHYWPKKVLFLGTKFCRPHDVKTKTYLPQDIHPYLSHYPKDPVEKRINARMHLKLSEWGSISWHHRLYHVAAY